MNIINREKGQGLVEYGLILALVSVVAVGALGGVGDKVTDTFNSVSNVDIDSKIAQGFIPISTADDLKSISIDETRKFGEGSIWEGDYISGLDKKYVQVKDIDLKNEIFNPIGDSSVEFIGEFDGGNFTIRNLKVNNGTLPYAGLFGYVKGGKISNVGLENVDVQGGNFTGGLVGRQKKSSVTNSYSSGKVIGSGYDVGGLIGASRSDSIVERSYSSGEVRGSVRNVGGLVGYNGVTSLVKDSFSNSEVSGAGGAPYIGGLVGRMNYESSIYSSYSTGLVRGQMFTGGLVGGLVGTNDSVVKDSYYDRITSLQ